MHVIDPDLITSILIDSGVFPKCRVRGKAKGIMDVAPTLPHTYTKTNNNKKIQNPETTYVVFSALSPSFTPHFV